MNETERILAFARLNQKDLMTMIRLLSRVDNPIAMNLLREANQFMSSQGWIPLHTIKKHRFLEEE
jgi:hypothetical protein